MYRAQVGCRGILLLFGRGILKIFISPEASNASEVLTIAYNYLVVMGGNADHSLSAPYLPLRPARELAIYNTVFL